MSAQANGVHVNPIEANDRKYNSTGRNLTVLPTFEPSHALLSTLTLLAKRDSGSVKPSDLTQNEDVKVALSALCKEVTTLVTSSLTPQPARFPCHDQDDTECTKQGGRGGGEPWSKNNTRGFNLLLLPNDRAWSVPEQKKPGQKKPGVTCSEVIFEVIDRTVECVQNAIPTHLKGGTPDDKLVFITIRDDYDSTSIPTFMEQWDKWTKSKKGPYHLPDGLILQTDRRRGCDVSQAVKPVRNAMATNTQLKKQLKKLWVSVGEDSYNDAMAREYGTLRLQSKGTDRPYFTDLRSECLLQQMDSINEACGVIPGIDKCGLLVHEFVDSFWRAGVQPSTPAAAAAQQECWKQHGAGMAFNEWRVLDGRPETTIPSSQAHLYHHYACGTSLEQGKAKRTTSFELASESGRFINVTRALSSNLPEYLMCSTSTASAASMQAIPPCHVIENVTTAPLDQYENVAWDGLMEPSWDPYHFTGACSATYTEPYTTLRPRRAYYMLRALWSPASNASSGDSAPAIVQGTESVLLGLALTFGVLVLVVCLQVTPLSVATSFVVLALVIGFAVLDAHVPLCGIWWDTAWDVVLLIAFLVIWAPLNGGGGSGEWWWVHAALFGAYLTFSDVENVRSQKRAIAAMGSVQCARTHPLLTLTKQLLHLLLQATPLSNPLVALPDDVCSSER